MKTIPEYTDSAIISDCDGCSFLNRLEAAEKVVESTKRMLHESNNGRMQFCWPDYLIEALEQFERRKEC